MYMIGLYKTTIFKHNKKQKKNSVVSVRKVNYTERATAACRRS
jgi:hypothetical protein